MSNNLVPVTYNNARILTTEQLAQIYECTERNISDNFNNNKKRFEEGKHYYLLQGEDLKSFKNQYENFGVVNKKASQLYIWTERGADRHCKMIGTDKAWEQFDHLEETYFRVKENNYSQPKLERNQPEKLETINKSVEIVSPLLDVAGVDNTIKLLVVKTLFSKAGVDIPIEIEAKEKFYDTKQIAKMVGMYSKTGNPAFGAVGQIIKKLDIEENEKEVVWESSGSWQGTVIKYTESVSDKVNKWLEENGHPVDIPSKNKTFHVVYKPLREVAI
ncbi:ORF6N domain-containing protein [Clostridium sp.]|uniref:ORF6N domain-containing protein n=1 Tax=Clostridium sp. TaxID=1506 RepID=UPI00359FD480